MSEVDIYGRVLATFSDLTLPVHLTFDDEGRVLVADCYNHRVQLLNDQLQLQRLIVSTKTDVVVWRPKQLCYNELTSHRVGRGRVAAEAVVLQRTHITKSDVVVWRPKQLCYNELTSQSRTWSCGGRNSCVTTNSHHSCTSYTAADKIDSCPGPTSSRKSTCD